MSDYVLMIAKSDPPLYVVSTTQTTVDPAQALKAFRTTALSYTRRYNQQFKDQGFTMRWRMVKLAEAPKPEWRQREASRFADGTYAALPWADNLLYPWFTKGPADHFAHVAMGNETMVAYTPDDAYGESDRQLRVRPGKYLKKFFGEVLTPEQIAHYAAAFSAEWDGELAFAVTADEIEHVYTSGPDSCMSKKLSDGAYINGLKVHPTRAYAGPDLQVAYLKRGQRITARTVCWPAKKLYTRVYGDSSRLESLLKAQGYGSCYADAPHNHPHLFLKDARLSKLKSGAKEKAYSWALPYIDGVGRVRNEPDYFVIDHANGTVELSTAGVGVARRQEDYA